MKSLRRRKLISARCFCISMLSNSFLEEINRSFSWSGLDLRNITQDYHRLLGVPAAVPGTLLFLVSTSIRTVSNVSQTRLNTSTFVSCISILNKYLSIYWFRNLSALLWKSDKCTIQKFIYSDLTISREYRCSISNAFSRRLIFSFNNTFTFNFIHA